MICRDDSECKEAFCEFGCMREHQTVVRNLIYHIMRNSEDVEDLTQEVFLRAYQSIHRYRGGSFRAYLGQIARNLCYDVLRRKKVRLGVGYVELVPDEIPSVERGPEDVAVTKQLAAEIREFLTTLPQIDREILLLRHVHQFSYDEISSVLGIKPGAVRTRISRARQKVMEEMERRDEHETSQLG